MNWNYEESNDAGPSGWPKLFGAGKRQSPINIVTSDLYQSLANVTCCNGQPNCGFESLNEKLNAIRISQNGSRPRRTRRTHLDSIGEDEQDDDRVSQLSTNETNEDKCGQATRFCTSKRKLFLGYPRYLDKIRLENTGHNWQVNIPPELSLHTLICGPAFGDREYRLFQFHCHWGRDSDHGSEHQINGRSYAAEIHFVHWNCKDFSSLEEASKHRHGLAVLAVLVQAIEGEQNRNKHLDRIVEPLEKLRRPNSSLEVPARLDIKRLFPANRWQYATYEGSLTTPPLTEVVDWLVFLNPIQCSLTQVDQFRQLECNSARGTQVLLSNCRPIQPSNGRLVSVWSHH